MNREFQLMSVYSPLFPHFVDEPSSLDNLFYSIKEAGTNYLFIEHINLPPIRLALLIQKLTGKVSDEMLKKFMDSQSDEHKAKLVAIIDELIQKYEFEVFGGGVLDHENLGNETKFFVK